MSIENYIVVYILDINFDLDLKIEKEKILTIAEKDKTIENIVNEQGVQDGDTWYPYSQIYKIKVLRGNAP